MKEDASEAPLKANSPTDEPARSRPTFWVEKSLVHDRPDRQEGPDRLGLALWSPQRAADGRDIYANMRDVRVGDFVFHLTDNDAITGLSVVAEPLDSGFGGVSGTKWSGGPCYRIALRDFRLFEPPLRREWFFGDPEIGERLRILATQPRGRGLFFNGKLELNQGFYLTEAPPPLVAALDKAYLRYPGCRRRSGTLQLRRRTTTTGSASTKPKSPLYSAAPGCILRGGKPCTGTSSIRTASWRLAGTRSETSGA